VNARPQALTQRQMYERSFGRPPDYFSLGVAEQWAVDKRLGILDWVGVTEDYTPEEAERFRLHYASPLGGEL